MGLAATAAELTGLDAQQLTTNEPARRR